MPTRHLLGTAWTRAAPCVGGRHFEVTALLGPAPTPWARVRLTAILTGRHLEIERSELRDDALWTAGWVRIV